MGKDTEITMIVDTKKINEHNVDQHVKFKDNRKNKNPSGDPANFTSEVNKGKHVFWYGEPEDEINDSIQITSITKKKQNDPEFLETKGKDPGHNGGYRARVKDEYIEGEESYFLEFTINNSGTVYQVDPKMVMAEK